MKHKTIIAHNCIKCKKELYYFKDCAGINKNFIYHNGKYMCKECFY